jgi:penicillin-binding protein 1C
MAGVAAATAMEFRMPVLALRKIAVDSQRFQVLDRHGEPLGITYQNRFNTTMRPLYTVPEFLRNAMIASEDRHFFEHNGVDWRARLAALWQNIQAGKAVRGASTISEQVVRIVHPRPRNLWSRWVEGFEAMALERASSKGEILEFYLNQVPYAANRKGVAQAARYYFNRELDTLTPKEMLALAVLPRAPSALDLYKDPAAIEPAIAQLAEVMRQRDDSLSAPLASLQAQPLLVQPPPSPDNVSHFLHYIRETVSYQASESGVLRTTLDMPLQRMVQDLLDQRIRALKRKQVHNGAALVADHVTGEILAWAVGGSGDAALSQQTPSPQVDAVRALRQPGSALKPFLYALALDSGWSPATLLDDAPMAEAIGSGLHSFKNYSHTFYGRITLREALGNSLNIPALQAVRHVGAQRYLDTLHDFGFASLAQPVDFYREGLALGIGEVSLFEMVQAYNALAHQGMFRPLTPLLDAHSGNGGGRVLSEESASLIGHILSDPFARRMEFGAGSILNLPVETAIKTGTSNDYRDAWVLGFNARYTVGVWLGNLDQTPMDGVTGSTGPALVLRSIFAELAQREAPRHLFLSPRLVQQDICSNGNAMGSADCFTRTEYFIAGTENAAGAIVPHSAPGLKLVRPTEGLQIAYDPRLPPELQAFEFAVGGKDAGQRIEWVLNGRPVDITSSDTLLWALQRGKYTLTARALGQDQKVQAEDVVRFIVK